MSVVCRVVTDLVTRILSNTRFIGEEIRLPGDIGSRDALGVEGRGIGRGYTPPQPTGSRERRELPQRAENDFIGF